MPSSDGVGGNFYEVSHAYAYVRMYMNNVIFIRTTSNIIVIGLFFKMAGLGGGSIWSENIGEAGT